MRALDRKLMRDLRRIWAQALAIALVMACGVSVLVLAHGSLHTLTETRDTYYERNRFADIFAGAVRAPEALAADIAGIGGVAQVETRIAEHMILDMPGMVEPGMARVFSLPADGAPVLNVPLLRQGRLPDPLSPDEVALSEPFADAHGLRPGDGFSAIMGGRLRDLRVTGTVLSPEYIYTIGPATLFPDDRRFGLFWMSHAGTAAAFDLDGAFNDLALRLVPGTDPAPVIAALDDLLAPYGGTGAHGRDRQTSHAFLQQELDQIATLARIMPPVFFIVSAFLVNMVVGRLVTLERQQIGLLKAVGYSTGEVAAHYLKLSAGIGLGGVLIGWGAGWWLADALARLYGEYFRFPYLIGQAALWPYAVSGGLALATVLAGAMRAVWATARLSPAVAMSPPAPPTFSRGMVDAAGQRLRLRQTTMMILRSVTRWPGRASVTLLGTAASVAVLVGSLFFYDAVEVMMDEMFTLSNRQHLSLTLTTAQTRGALIDARNLPGVLDVEGGYTLPVRLMNGPREKLVALEARGEGAELVRVLDRRGRAVGIPPGGVVLPQLLAQEIGAGAGDLIGVEFMAETRETHVLPVAAIIRQTLGEAAYIHEDTLFSLLRQAPRVNRINLMADTAELPALYAQVKATPAIGGVALWSEVQAQFRREIDESLMTVVFIYALLGILIAVGVIYNAARIQLAERTHELVSLRVLGFTRAEVGFVLVGEIMLLAVIGLPVGLAAGYGLAALTAGQMSSQMFEIPLVVSGPTYAWSAIIVFVSALISVLMVRRRLDRVDLVSALKQKE